MKYTLEETLHYIYKYKITPENFKNFKKELYPLFDSEKEYNEFVKKYFLDAYRPDVNEFMKPQQKIDAFPVIRHQQDTVVLPDFFELKYVLHGNAGILLENHSLMMNESDICLVIPYCHQQLFFFDDKSQVITIVIRKEYLTQLFPRLFTYRNQLQEFFMQDFSADTGINYFLHINTQHDSHIRQLIQNIFTYFHNQQTHDLLHMQIYEGMLEEVMLRLLADHIESFFTNTNASADSDNIYQILSYLRKHLASASLSDLAEKFHYSKAYASKIIKKYTGRNYSEIIRTMRLEEAGKLLTQTNISVEQILISIGYSSRTNFLHIFKEYYHMLPSEYRKNFSK